MSQKLRFGRPESETEFREPPVPKQEFGNEAESPHQPLSSDGLTVRLGLETLHSLPAAPNLGQGKGLNGIKYRDW